MRDLSIIRRELATAQAELTALLTMSETEACKFHNVDCKREAEEVINEDIAELEKELQEAEEYAMMDCDPDAIMERAMFHFAFPTSIDFYRYKGC